MSPAPELEVDRISVRLGSSLVLREVSVSAHSGEFLAVAGPNGSGKTTLIRAVLGLVPWTGGEVRLSGDRTDRLPHVDRAQRAAWMPQEEPPGDNVSLEEYVRYGRHPYLRRFEAESPLDRGAVVRALEEVGLADRRTGRVWELSGGERQRLRLARVLAQTTRVLLLDEPTAHLDMAHQLEVLERVRQLCHGQGRLALVALHDINLAARFADRIVVLQRGQLVVDGPPREVLSPQLFLGVWGILADLRADPRSGTPYLIPRLPREAASALRHSASLRVHVVGGGGSAAPTLRRLAEAGFRVTAGAIPLFDTDQATADELGVPVVTEVPFSPLRDETRETHREWIAAADAVVVAPFPVGPGNLANLEDLLPFAGRMPVLILGASDWDRRDFTGGAAPKVGERLLAEGAEAVPDVDAAVLALKQRVPTSAARTWTAPGALPPHGESSHG